MSVVVMFEVNGATSSKGNSVVGYTWNPIKLVAGA